MAGPPAHRLVTHAWLTSTGVDPRADRPTPPNVAEEAIRARVDMSECRSTPVSEDLLRAAGLILFMDLKQYDQLRSHFPQHLERALPLGLFAEPVTVEIDDPNHQDAIATRRILIQIEGAVVRLAEMLGLGTGLEGRPEDLAGLTAGLRRRRLGDSTDHPIGAMDHRTNETTHHAAHPRGQGLADDAIRVGLPDERRPALLVLVLSTEHVEAGTAFRYRTLDGEGHQTLAGTNLLVLRIEASLEVIQGAPERVSVEHADHRARHLHAVESQPTGAQELVHQLAVKCVVLIARERIMLCPPLPSQGVQTD